MSNIKESAEIIKEGAELVEGRMTFVQDFLQKKYGFGILFFVLLIAAGFGFWWFYSEGKKEGSKSSQLEIISYKAVRKSDSISIIKLRTDLISTEIELISCRTELNKKQDFSQLKASIQQKIAEADEISRMFRKETIPENKKLNKNLKKIINQ